MFPTAQALARTYSDRVYTDPWAKVQDYRRVQAYTAEHPSHGRTRIGNALELPPSRVRTWINGGMPDPVRGIQAALDHGWLASAADSATAAGLVKLLAHILAGGSISATRFTPAVTTTQRVSRESIHAVFAQLDVSTTLRHAETETRATEVVPTPDGSVLGRCLVTMGAPAGDKTALECVPAAVWDVPRPVQRSFAQIYLAHRASTHTNKPIILVQESRSQAYLQDLQTIFATVTGESPTVGMNSITLSVAAARALDIAP